MTGATVVDTCLCALLLLLSSVPLLPRACWPTALHQIAIASTAVPLKKTSASSCTLLSRAHLAAEKFTFDSSAAAPGVLHC